MSDPKKLIEEARARAEKASPGPWIEDGEYGCDNVRAPKLRMADDDSIEGAPGICYTEGYTFEDDDGNPLPCQDAAFIAHAREDIPALCDLAEQRGNALEAALKENELLKAEKELGPDPEEYRRKEDYDKSVDYGLEQCNRAEAAEAQVASLRPALAGMVAACMSDSCLICHRWTPDHDPSCVVGEAERALGAQDAEGKDG